MTCCNAPEPINTQVELPDGDVCLNNEQFKDMFTYFKDAKLDACLCDPKRYTVNFNFVDVNTYSFVVTDQLTGESIEYSVPKYDPKEKPQTAFNRDWVSRELLHNRDIVSDLRDIRVSLSTATQRAELKSIPKGYTINKPLGDSQSLSQFVYRMKEIPFVNPTLKTLQELLESDLAGVVLSPVYFNFLLRLQDMGVGFTTAEYLIDPSLNRVSIQAVKAINEYTTLGIEVILVDLEDTNGSLNEILEYYNLGNKPCLKI